MEQFNAVGRHRGAEAAAAAAGCCTAMARPTAVDVQATTRSQTVSTPARSRAESGVELGHHLPCARRLEPQGGGLGQRRAGRPSHRSRFDQRVLTTDRL